MLHKNVLLLLFLCLAAFQLPAQQFTKVTGVVRDVNTKQPLAGASVAEKGQENGAITDENGYFELTMIGKRKVLRVTYLGYQAREHKVKTSETKLIIFLKSDEILMPTTTISDSRLQRVHPDKQLHIFDYHFIGNHTVMILRNPRKKNNRIELLDQSGTTIDLYDDMPENPLSFYKDCLGNLHYLSKSFAWQLDLADDMLIPRKDSLHRFREVVEPCTALLDSTYYFAFEPSRYVRQFIYVRADEKRKRHLYASVDKRAIFTHEDEALMPERYVSPEMLINPARPEYSDWVALDQRSLNHLLLREPYIPLKIVQEQAVVFDHLKKKILKFDPMGQKVGEVEIAYPQSKHWKRNIITDQARNRAFAVYEKNGMTSLAKIDLETGTLGEQWELPKQFVKNIKVRKGFIYFLYKDSMYDPIQKLYRYEM